LRNWKRRGVEVVEALGVSSFVYRPGNTPACNGDLRHAAARARRVGTTRLLPAHERGTLRHDVPDEDLRAAASAARDRVDQAGTVHSDRLDPAVRVLHMRRGRSRRCGGGRGRDDGGEEQTKYRGDAHVQIIAPLP